VGQIFQREVLQDASNKMKADILDRRNGYGPGDNYNKSRNEMNNTNMAMGPGYEQYMNRNNGDKRLNLQDG